MSAEYLRALREQVAGYAGTWKDVVVLAPSYARLMFHLLRNPRLASRHRLWVDAAIAYLVSPHDVIPEGEVGPYGYVDDIFCCAYVANRVAYDLGWDQIEEGWEGDGSARDISERILAREQELLGHIGDDVLKFAGLYDLERRDREHLRETVPAGAA
jgi:uncharacterized membrane protein YkvA (DUF1232 family)